MTDPTITVIDGNGVAHELPAPAGWRLMEIIRDAGLPMRAECGGSAACATCHVHVAQNWADKLPKPKSDEADMLDTVPAFDAGRSRLACQIIMQDELSGLTVVLAP